MNPPSEKFTKKELEILKKMFSVLGSTMNADARLCLECKCETDDLDSIYEKISYQIDNRLT